MTPRSANHATARSSTPIAVTAFSAALDLDVGHAGVVVDDGVQERVADVGFVVRVSFAGAFRGAPRVRSR